ncbi:MAG: hypothetical protein SVX28_10640 [Pseudomonadota bacterium]|nr:hypothetical protein [Pseudomonadota bacterium]
MKPNPTLQPTGYSGLRPLPPSAEVVSEGEEKVIRQLTYLMVQLAMLSSKMTERQALLEIVSKKLGNEEDAQQHAARDV